MDALRCEAPPESGLHVLLRGFKDATLVFTAQSATATGCTPCNDGAAVGSCTPRTAWGKTSSRSPRSLSHRCWACDASVSEVASELQREGLISYNRGSHEVLDRADLKRTSCECYGVIKKEFDRLLDSGGTPPLGTPCPLDFLVESLGSGNGV